jgi:spore maturation protein CgeB
VKIVIFGLSITSSWGNGHATTFRALARALNKRGHKIVFFEKDVEWYASNRDLPNPDFCNLRLYSSWSATISSVRAQLSDADVAVVGSYFPDGVAALDEALSADVPVKAFYDIDTPITVVGLRENGGTDYLRAEQVEGLDVYFSFTGGPILNEIESRFGARRAVPLYCSFDPEKYHTYPVATRYACDLSYMGTYAPDRQPKLESLLFETARRLPDRKFIVAGPQYPRTVQWPKNIRRITHLNPRWHPHFYSSSRLTLNLTRRDMVMAGYSPSVRLFEAAACGAGIVTDNWPGLSSFLKPGQEILLPTSADDLVHYLRDIGESELKRIGERAQHRVLAHHTSAHRAEEFERAVMRAADCRSRQEKQPVVAFGDEHCG